MTAIGYLISQYPYASHTFVRREVAAMRAAGLTIRTYSIRCGEPSPEDAMAQAEAETTYAVLGQSVGSFLGANVAALLSSPIRYFSTLRLALRHRVPGLKALVWAFFYFAEAILLARQLRRDGVTRLHNHFANAGATVGMLAAHQLRLPWSLTLHGISEFDYPAGLMLPEKLERAEFAACVSYFGMAQAMRITRPAIWLRYRLVRCGIDLTDLPSTPNKAAGDVLELVCVGRLSPEKGHAGLLGALAKLLRDGASIRLTLVGDGPEGEALHALAGQLGLADHVIFAGRLGEQATLETIARSDALVLTSFMEGLPIVLMEAMALGVPVVASRVAGIPELVADGENGLLFEPANWDQLATAIKRLCDDPVLRSTLANRARSRVSEEFTYPGAAQPLIDLFRASSGEVKAKKI